MSLPKAREVTLQNCRLRNPCPKPWDGMLPVNATGTIRFCDECQKNVHLCRTDKELASNVRAGNCVAFFRSPPRSRHAPSTMLLGDVACDYDPKG